MMVRAWQMLTDVTMQWISQYLNLLEGKVHKLYSKYKKKNFLIILIISNLEYGCIEWLVNHRNYYSFFFFQKKKIREQ